MKKPSQRVLKSVLCCALLTLPAAHGEPRHFSNSAAILPPKAHPPTGYPTKEKIYVSVSGATTVDKTKSVQATKAAAPKVSISHPATPNSWHFVPKVVDGGKEDTTYGFILNHRF
ncbi:MAG: hypothetical protein ABI162_07530 [Luteolibacter sp.]